MAPAKSTPAQAQRGVRRVSESFFSGDELYAQGTTVRVGHPIIDEYPQFFATPGLADVELPE
jgi:hypothetical protein